MMSKTKKMQALVKTVKGKGLVELREVPIEVKAAMKMLFICTIAIFFFSISPVRASASTDSLLDIKISNVRHSYYRNEDVTFEIVIQNVRPVPEKNVTLSIELGPLKPIKKT